MAAPKLSRNDLKVGRLKDHWGEYENRQQPLSNDLIRRIILEAEKPVKTKDYLFSSKRGNGGGAPPPPEITPVNEVLRHTVRLNFYSKRLQHHIRQLESEGPRYRGTPLPPEVRYPPEMSGGEAGREEQTCPLPAPDDASTRLLLERAVVSILAQAGYDSVQRAAFDTLVDVLIHLLSNICRLCHSFAQHDLNRGQVGYDDVLEKSLRTIGLDGIHAVKDYTKRQIFKRDKAMARSQRLLKIYQDLLGKNGFTSSTTPSP